MATISDVAKRAFVSSAAVSAVMNNKNDQVSPQTRKRILDAVRELNYVPSRVARQLKTGKSETIALVFERMENHGYSNPSISHLVSGIGDSAADAGLFVLLAPSGTKRSFAETVLNLSSHGVDGAVVVGPLIISETIAAIENSGVPIVCIDSYPNFTKAVTVDLDNYAGMAGGVQHLATQGHTRIAYFGHSPMFQCFTDRMRAFCDVMQANGLPLDHRSIRVVSSDHLEDSVEEMLRSSDPPTAVVCDDGVFGEQAWSAITARGLRVPEDVAMFASDQFTEGHPGNDLLSYACPQPYEQGKAAADALGKLIIGELISPVNIKVPPRLVLVPCPPLQLTR